MSVQVFAGTVRETAESVAREAAGKLSEAVRVDLEGGVFKVRVGTWATPQDAAALLEQARALGYRDAFLTTVTGRQNGREGVSR